MSHYLLNLLRTHAHHFHHPVGRMESDKVADELVAHVAELQRTAYDSGYEEGYNAGYTYWIRDN